jgi:hypothetical protein
MVNCYTFTSHIYFLYTASEAANQKYHFLPGKYPWNFAPGNAC